MQAKSSESQEGLILMKNEQEGYLELLSIVENTAIKCHRDPKEVKIVAVSKTYPWKEVSFCYEEGCRLFGESRVQEALIKQEEAPKDIEWHFIGTLQKNKVRKIINKFSLLHSVNSLELAEKISEVSLEENTVTKILLQINTSYEPTKHGFLPEQFEAVISKIGMLEGVEVQGLMTMAPLTKDEKTIRSCFQNLRKIQTKFSSKDLPLEELSMGMSEDYKIAIEEGATLLRLGTILFGKRN